MIEVDNKALKGYKFIDLFCGIGGFHLALSSFGAKCVFASDIDKEAKAVYKKNFDLEPADDITKIKSTGKGHIAHFNHGKAVNVINAKRCM